jgi:Fusaric acid resistance protein-like
VSTAASDESMITASSANSAQRRKPSCRSALWRPTTRFALRVMRSTRSRRQGRSHRHIGVVRWRCRVQPECPMDGRIGAGSEWTGQVGVSETRRATSERPLIGTCPEETTTWRIDKGVQRITDTVVRRWAYSVWPIAQQTAAAVIAWMIAVHFAGHSEPFFAPIAAIVGLNVTGGRRGSNAVRLLIGVVVGIAVAELVVEFGWRSLVFGAGDLLRHADRTSGGRSTHRHSSSGCQCCADHHFREPKTRVGAVGGRTDRCRGGVGF